MRKTDFTNTSHKAERKNNILKNRLWIYRKRMEYSQKMVAYLLGHKSTTHISDYECGKRLPGLETALKLEIILRVPVAFLYGALYSELKREIRQAEEEYKKEHG